MGLKRYTIVTLPNGPFSTQFASPPGDKAKGDNALDIPPKANQFPVEIKRWESPNLIIEPDSTPGTGRIILIVGLVAPNDTF